ncbi:DVU_1553 family AMP-dependent CoA ligase [Desulfovibrio sp. MES5]|uniref:DVU_1553 family AMP-dependent CoA ligase n=1 Tax=Desulfovibrio sp. MES5 TaxID=1899016 RepID=UPI0025B839BE|nr:phenylacetate--CoA ligase family protein [Desulfovibrio sp. MES5]
MMRTSSVRELVARSTGLGGALSPQSLARWQMDRLREQIAWAQRAPHYRQTLRHIQGCDLKTTEDLPRLPFTTAEHLRHAPASLVCVSQGEVARIITLATSGTSGRHKRIFFSEHDLARCMDFFAQGMRDMVSPGGLVHILLPGNTEGGTVDLLHNALGRDGVRVALHGFPRQPEKIDFFALPALPKEHPDCLLGQPVAILRVAHAHPGLRPTRVLLCADYVPLSIIARIERMWGSEVFTHYGSTESGLGGGVECCARQGYHWRHDDLLLEIVDPLTGAALPPGQWGEVVITTLRRKAMPLIRYRTGDRGRLLNTPCPCGCDLPRLDRIAGRFDNDLHFSGGGRLSIHMLDEILFALPEVLDYTAVLRDDFTLELSVCTRPDASFQKVRDALEECGAIPKPFTLHQNTCLPLSPAKRVIQRNHAV